MSCDVVEHLILALGLVDGQVEGLLDSPDLLHHARPLIQQPQDFHVQDVDALAAFGQCFHAHGFFDGKPLESSRVRASSFAGRSGLAAFCSTTRTTAVPTTTPSATLPTVRTWSAVEIPNPTANGSSVTVRIAFTSGVTASETVERSPVTPVRETR